ncbi:MAG TPA: hypothetical protein VHB50_17790 [Bryobacteraceae bacterium]|nr:hypothetical protein [Bryobacteraceae bacterium]
MLAAAALLIAMYPDWVPARWPSADLKSLDLLAHTPINCLWLERPQWSAAFAAEAAKRGIATLGVIHREGDPIEAARELAKSGFTGGVIEGAFDDYSLLIISGTLAKAKMPVIESGSRSRLHFDSDLPLLSTSQGMWPGIHVEKGGSASAGPTANPWIDTNTGFLRFARAATDATIWVAVQPPPKTVYPVQRYLQAIGDAAMNGSRWVISLDDDLWRRLMAREPKALKDWSAIAAALRHFEDHREWRSARPAGEVGLIEDYDEARLSGGLFDMLAAKHVPVFAMPSSNRNAPAVSRARVVINPDPARQTSAPEGAAIVEGPALTAKRPPATEDDFIFDATDTRPNTIWQKASAVIGRQNMGARLFNVSSMLSNVLALRGQKQLVLHLVNYSDYPASGITARVLGVYRHARLYRPGEPPVDLETEKVEDGTGVSIDERIVTIGTVVFE